MRETVDVDELVGLLTEARTRTLELVADLTPEDWLGPRLPIVNPPLWEVGHLAWFQEKWLLRHLLGEPPIRPDMDALYDSAAIPHDVRWDLPLPPPEVTRRLMQRTLESCTDVILSNPRNEATRYFGLLALFHEDMHAEALTYTRQTLGRAAPSLSLPSQRPAENGSASAADTRIGGGAWPGDVEIPGGRFPLGATPNGSFVFDNEKWAHPVEVAPFLMARAPITNAEFAAFTDDGGYSEDRWWSGAGGDWKRATGARHPVYWRREAPGRWLRRVFDQEVSLEANLPVLHVNWYEAEAYCRWAGRRLPTEAEWEMAAAGDPESLGAGSPQKRRFPWGDEPPTPERANLDWRAGGVVEVGALPASDSAFGCRQMIGNVWEWTSDDFAPYPGFEVDPYQEYSAPWFGTHKVLRGGCWTTRAHLIRTTWRNFYTPDRRDVWAGFRTCALDRP